MYAVRPVYQSAHFHLPMSAAGTGTVQGVALDVRNRVNFNRVNLNPHQKGEGRCVSDELVLDT
jgi:hypothetical protein